MPSADQALERTRDLLAVALAPNSTSQSRRIFREQLITLSSHPSYESKAFFGTLVAKFFGEFEDLQDATIDALLDLCEDEDEKVRIIGIKGLGPTGRADPRWVRGNTGVLLQLLACQPRELKHVRESLHTLLSVAPIDVLSVMTDDCKGSEEETGASRRNIIEFLYHDETDIRKDVIESGKNTAAEDVFRDGFLEVLDKVGGAESKMVLEMLANLPSVSGRTATEQTRGRYVKALIRSTPSHSSSDSTIPLIRIFSDCLSTDAPLDPRLALLFLAEHGKAVVQLGMSKNDPPSRKILEGLKSWTDGSIKRWDGREEDKDLSEETLGSKLGMTVLSPFLHECNTLPRTGNFSHAGGIIEMVLYAIYRLSTTHDRRSKIVQSQDSRALRDLADDAERAERRVAEGSTESRIWVNIIDMAEILASTRRRIVKITPSWETNMSRPAAVPSSSGSAGPSNKPYIEPARPFPAPRGPKSQAPPSAPRSSSSAGPSNITSTSRGAPTGPRLSNGAHATSTHAPTPPPVSAPTGPSSARARGPPSPSRKVTTPSGPRIRPRSPSRSPPRTVQTATPPRPLTPPLPSLPATFKPVTVVSRDLEPSQTASIGITMRGHAVDAMRKEKTDISTPLIHRGVNAKPINGTSIKQSAKSTTESPGPRPEDAQRTLSLADRLGVSKSTSSPSLSIKRARQDDGEIEANGTGEDKTTNSDGDVRPSLLSRLSAREGQVPPPKRVKEDMTASGTTNRLSLKDRISGNSSHGGSPATLAPPHSATTFSTSNARPGIPPLASKPTGLSFLNRSSSPQMTQNGQQAHGVPQAGQSTVVSVKTQTPTSGFSILNRASTNGSAPSPTAQPPSQPKSQRSTSGMSILASASRSGTTTTSSEAANTSGFSILNRASIPTAPRAASRSPPIEEEVVVRKGRGFRARTPDDIVMADSNRSSAILAVPVPSFGPGAQVGPGGGLASRLGGQGGINTHTPAHNPFGRGGGGAAGPFGSGMGGGGGRGLVRPNHMGRGRR